MRKCRENHHNLFCDFILQEFKFADCWKRGKIRLKNALSWTKACNLLSKLRKCKQIGRLKTLTVLKLLKRVLSFIRSSPNSTSNCHNPRGIKLLSRLRFGLSYLREHKFKHSFQDSLKPLCSCGKSEIETSSHYLPYCSNYSEERLAFLNTIKNIDMSILQHSDSKFTTLLIFGDASFFNNKSTFILDATIDYLISTGRFDLPLFNSS